ncbi:MAG: hypothetical protein ABJE10_17345, partial [bacterium]
GTGTGDLCTIKALAIYAEDQQYHAAQSELNHAWFEEGQDMADLAVALAEGDEEGVARATAKSLVDDANIARAQIEVDELLDDLNAAAADYWASGC